MHPARLLIPLCLVLALLAGCKGPCRQLSEKLCECAENTYQREACLRRVSSESSRVQVTPQDEQRCEELLPGCDCHATDAAEGKRACGLAR